MTPLNELKWKAEPGSGEISQLVIVPPAVVGLECGLIPTLIVPTISLYEYESVGTSSLIVMLMVAEVEPPELFAQMV